MDPNIDLNTTRESDIAFPDFSQSPSNTFTIFNPAPSVRCDWSSRLNASHGSTDSTGSDTAQPQDTPSKASLARAETLGPPQAITNQHSGSGSVVPRYPVLDGIIEKLRIIMPDPVSYSLLEYYFKVSVATETPLSPHAPPSILRKASVLALKNPRRCSAALLTSILWLSAQTADIPLLKSRASKRKAVRRQLLELTISLLKPLSGFASSQRPSCPLREGQQPHHESMHLQHQESHNDEPVDNPVDDILTYTNLAMVTSAGEFRASSLRWWSLAFSLAREANMNQEDPRGGMSEDTQPFAGAWPHLELTGCETASGGTCASRDDSSAERQEERRRLWWFLFTVDRHLALCYNKPLSIRDSECPNLLHPMPESVWRSTGASFINAHHENGSLAAPCKGPWLVCTGTDYFGFFTPLMTILGEIMDFFHTKNHPRLGASGCNGSSPSFIDWARWKDEICKHISAYGDSLTKVSEQSSFATSSLTTFGDGFRIGGSTQAETAVAYARLLLRILSILVDGGLDPLYVLDPQRGRPSAPENSATANPMEAIADLTRCTERLLDLDPGMSFMPFYSGIYLLHGGFLLLVATDRRSTTNDDSLNDIVNATTAMIRIHEASIVMLRTEYQRELVFALRSAMFKIRGRATGDAHSSSTRWEALTRYRWTSEGSGIAG
ncbi:unnamed protein product [Clonostachys solani]|uniref:Xylanolytic transcriptional activator regulatory domain-containing protein n=1 Tax=Clonostachys solani TaxID=160281 RepID=A0A9P0EQQ8_9HYPO|nr:unnamed protein product [Clonostachys solani]